MTSILCVPIRVSFWVCAAWCCVCIGVVGLVCVWVPRPCGVVLVGMALLLAGWSAWISIVPMFLFDSLSMVRGVFGLCVAGVLVEEVSVMAVRLYADLVVIKIKTSSMPVRSYLFVFSRKNLSSLQWSSLRRVLLCTAHQGKVTN